MNAISVKQPWANYIVTGMARVMIKTGRAIPFPDWVNQLVTVAADQGWPLKTIETRRWPSPKKYIGGDIVICSSKRPDIWPSGRALAVVKLAYCRQMILNDERSAGCPFSGELISWCLENIRPLAHPVPIKGRQGIFELDLEEASRLAGLTMDMDKMLSLQRGLF